MEPTITPVPKAAEAQQAYLYDLTKLLAKTKVRAGETSGHLT